MEIEQIVGSHITSVPSNYKVYICNLEKVFLYVRALHHVQIHHDGSCLWVFHTHHAPDYGYDYDYDYDYDDHQVVTNDPYICCFLLVDYDFLIFCLFVKHHHFL
jgi:hypothetical protein